MRTILWTIAAGVMLALLVFALVGVPVRAGLIGPAFAQAAPDTTVSGGPWFAAIRPYLEAAVSAAVLAVLGWFSALVSKWVGVSLDRDARDRLHSAAMTGVASGLDYLQAKAGALTVDTRNEVIAHAVRWAETSVPDAIKRLGATPEALVQIASSKLTILAEAPTSVPVGRAPTPPNA